jgi:secreted PhoX family phosphatase
MLKVRGRDNFDLGAPLEGDVHDVEWVPVAEPDAAAERREISAPNAPLQVGLGKSGPFLQGEALGAAAFRRLEGCFPHAGLVYFTDTTGGAAGSGVVWALAPGDDETPDVLRCVYVSAGQHEADRVDNLCVGPRGGMVMCEDGGGERGLLSLQRGNRLIGLDARSLAFAFAENNMIIESRMPRRPWIATGDFRGSEFAGVCYAPRGDRMFVNVQTPGVTFEIFGPWERGPL